MKKSVYLGVIALATLSLTSCLKDEVVESIPQNDAIEFGTYLGRDVSTRGTVWDTEAMEADGAGFGVFAFYTGQTAWASSNIAPNFMYNQQVTWDATANNGAGAWVYNPKKYWPATKAVTADAADKITFFAYAPMATDNNGMTVSAKSDNGTPTVTYEITAGNLDNMADFVADAVIDKTKTVEDISTDGLDDEAEPVTFTLLHELTRVNIQAKLSVDAFSSTDGNVANKTKVNIKDIRVVGPTGFMKATYTFANTNDVTSTSPVTLKRGSWAFDSNASNEFSIFDGNSSQNLIADAEASGLGNYKVKGVSVPTTAVVSVFNSNKYLFLIPVNGETGVADGSKVYFDIDYDIVTADASLNATYSCTPAKKRIELPAGTLQQGVAYNFILTFGLNEVTLSASVAEWNTPDATSTPPTELGEDVDYDDTDNN